MRVYFKNLELEVPETVYEPREDSFLIAEELKKLNLRGKKVLDLGTGSGILALLAAKTADEVLGVDVNEKAVETAKNNACLNKIENARFLKSNLFEKVEGKFDVIVFNPPYMPTKKEFGSIEEKAWVGGQTGRKTSDLFLKNFEKYLKKGGIVLMIQSSLSKPEKTLEKFGAKIIAKKKIPWEELVVIKLFK